MRDLELISGNFFDCEIPREKGFLTKYFVTDIEMAFLRYYLIFGDSHQFTDHTGIYCCKRFRLRMVRRVKKLTKLYTKAKSELTEESIEIIRKLESGEYPLTRPDFY